MAKDTPHTDHNLELLGKRIRFLRKQSGYSSAEKFAYKHEINRVQFQRYETGGDMHVSTLFRVIEALGVTPAEFFSEGFGK